MVLALWSLGFRALGSRFGFQDTGLDNTIAINFERGCFCIRAELRAWAETRFGLSEKYAYTWLCYSSLSLKP